MDSSKDKIILGISNRNRRKILCLLYKNKTDLKKQSQGAPLSEIAKKLKMSDQAIQKHMTVLLDSGLVLKEQNHGKRNSKSILLTNIGEAIIQQINGIDFLEKNKDYFKTHTLSYLPESFIARIGALKNCKKSSVIAKNIEHTKNMIANHAKQFYKIAYDQAIVEIYKFGIQAVKKRNIKASYIMSKDTKIPREFLPVYKSANEAKMISKGQLQRRMMDQTNIILCVADTASLVMFPNNEGGSGVTMFYDENNEEFQGWCNDLYEDMWKRSNTFVESEIPVEV